MTPGQLAVAALVAALLLLLKSSVACLDVTTTVGSQKAPSGPAQQQRDREGQHGTQDAQQRMQPSGIMPSSSTFWYGRAALSKCNLVTCHTVH